MSKSETLSKMRITPEMKGRLERLAIDDGRSLTGYVRWVLAQHLKSVECLRELASETATVEVSGLEHVDRGTIMVTLDGQEVEVVK